MREYINFLEKMIKEYKTFGDLANPEFEDTDKIYQAIENLIAGYKELEANLYETNNIISDQIELLKDSISKSLVREKVIEVKNRPVKDEFITASQGKLNTIIDLEELLEERR